MASEIKKHGATFVVCELEPGVADIPAKYGLQPEIGGIYPFIEDVIKAYQERGTDFVRSTSAGPPSAGLPMPGRCDGRR